MFPKKRVNRKAVAQLWAHGFQTTNHAMFRPVWWLEVDDFPLQLGKWGIDKHSFMMLYATGSKESWLQRDVVLWRVILHVGVWNPTSSFLSTCSSLRWRFGKGVLQPCSGTQVVELVEMQSGGHAEVAGNASWWGKASSEPTYPSLQEK